MKSFHSNPAGDRISFELLNHQKLLVHISSSLKNKVELLKTTLKDKGGYWCTKANKWIVDHKRHQELLKAFQAVLQQYEIDPAVIQNVPAFVQDFAKPIPLDFKFKVKTARGAYEGFKIAYSPDEERLRSIQDLHPDFRAKLFKFQEEGIKFGIEKLGRLLIADEMGVGKTIQALGLCGIYSKEWPVLIICPSSLKYNWGCETKKWLQSYLDDPEKEVQVIYKGSDSINPKAKVVIISFDLGKNIVEMLAVRRFKVIVCDEAHYLKTTTSKRTQALLPLLQKAKRAILLTGTPALAKPVELYPILTAVRPDIYSEIDKFGTRYCDPKHNFFSKKLEYNGADNIFELNHLLKNVMIRRLKKDVLKDLPEKLRQIMEIQGSSAEVKQIKSLVSDLEKETGLTLDSLVERLGDQEGNAFLPKQKAAASAAADGKKLSSLTVSAKVYELTAKAKIEPIKEYLTDMIEYNQKLVIFGFHMCMLDALEEFAREKKIKYIRIDGSVESEARGKLVETFQADQTVKYAILGITAASTGLTLTASQTVIFSELYWTPATMNQAEDRCHRISQQSSVTCIYFVAKDTLDPAMLRMIEKKFSLTGHILDGDNAQTMDFEKVGAKKDGQITSYFTVRNEASLKTQEYLASRSLLADNYPLLGCSKPSRHKLSLAEQLELQELDQLLQIDATETGSRLYADSKMGREGRIEAVGPQASSQQRSLSLPEKETITELELASIERDLREDSLTYNTLLDFPQPVLALPTDPRQPVEEVSEESLDLEDSHLSKSAKRVKSSDPEERADSPPVAAEAAASEQTPNN